MCAPRYLLSLLVMFLPFLTFSQEQAAVDSLKQALREARSPEEKVYLMDNLSRVLMNVNLAESESMGQQLIQFAEETRNRKLMIEAYMSNGQRCGYFAGQKEYISRSLGYYEKALELSRQNKFEDKRGATLLRIAHIYLQVPDQEKALLHANQAASIISTLQHDSLLAESHLTYGRVYQVKNEKTLALRHILTGLRLAEKTKEPALIRSCYILLSRFYSGIEDYDRAIDYYVLANKQLDKMTQRNVPYSRVVDTKDIGDLYAYKKSYEIAINYYQRSMAMADSLRYTSLRIPGSIGLLNLYLMQQQPALAREYLHSKDGKEIEKFLNDMGFGSVIHQAYAVVYSDVGKYDSADFHFSRALPYFDTRVSGLNRLNFFHQLASHYKKSGRVDLAISNFLEVKRMAEKDGILEFARLAAKDLDTLYAAKGDFRQAAVYNSAYYQIKDSIEKLNKEKEIAQVEAADEQQRLEKELLEKEEAKQKKHRIQYMAIIIAIALVFIIMVMMGFFRVSAATIRIIGFFAFLLFFEFIFLIFKKNIFWMTNGEPLKDLAFMIALAAVLVPLHHFTEHRVIHFLTSHRMLKLKNIFTERKAGSDKPG